MKCANPLAIAVVVAVALGVHLFVVFYEEPTLRGKFGAERGILPERKSMVAARASLAEAAIA